jgi:hypothetical protein
MVAKTGNAGLVYYYLFRHVIDSTMYKTILFSNTIHNLTILKTMADI